MVNGQLGTCSLFKLQSRNNKADAASSNMPLRLVVTVLATPPVDGVGLGGCIEVADIMEGVDPGVVGDDCVAIALDGRLTSTLLAVPVDASATKELIIDEYADCS